MLNTIYFSNSTDPFFNLALEETLFNSQDAGFTFYLWQNESTVVIGKNQNAWRECRISLLEQEGGRLARRSSGGGAVFHDLGNLNFTFITPRDEYDVTRQLSVIQLACESFCVNAEFTGRNDLTADGAKFSGNAFRFSSNKGMHHGTVLINVDMAKLSRYLAPSPEKLASKGVESVRSRVVNLSELNPNITVESMKRALVDAFIKLYGPSRLGRIKSLDQDMLNRTMEKCSSWEWKLGGTPKFDITLENRFDFGGIEFHLSLKKGRITDIKVYSDAMDETFIESIAPALIGKAFNSSEMAMSIRSLAGENAEQIAVWIEEKGF